MGGRQEANPHGVGWRDLLGPGCPAQELEGWERGREGAEICGMEASPVKQLQ